MSDEGANGAPDSELAAKVKDEAGDSVMGDGANDGGESVPDPTAAKVGTEDKTKTDDDPGEGNEDGDKSKEDDGGDSVSEDPLEHGPPGTIAPGGGNKLLKELDDEAPKTFPQVLMEILTNDEDSDTISWLPHGRSFIIYKKKKFASTVLPKFFKATKFTSFTRKLNRWGFTRVTRGPEMGSYYHKMFLRDDPQLCLRMSSHSANKYHEPQQLIPNPMQPGMPFMPFGMPGIMPGMPMQMNPVDLSQQNQLINQQLQQLQWQQFQLQQFQQQQHGNPHAPPPGQQQHPPHGQHPGHHPGQPHHAVMHHPHGPSGGEGYLPPPMHQHPGMHPHHEAGPHQAPPPSQEGHERGPGDHRMPPSSDHSGQDSTKKADLTI